MHSIQKQSVQLTISDFGESSNWQNRLEGLCLGPLSKELEAIFDDLAVGEQLVEIERLEIDLSIHSLAISDQQLIEKIKQEIQSRLTKTIGEKAASQSYQKVIRPGATAQQEALVFPELSPSHPDLKGTAKAFLIFLESGLLPWWYEQPSPAVFRSKIIEEVFQNSTTSRSTFIHLWVRLLEKTKVQQRLFRSFPVAFHRQLFSFLLPSFKHLIIAVIDLLEKEPIKELESNKREYRLKRLLEIIQPQLLNHSETHPLELQLFIFLQSLIALPTKTLFKKLAEKEVEEKQLKRIEEQLIAFKKENKNTAQLLSSSELKKTPKQSSSNDSTWTIGGAKAYDEIYIQNAGLVLLAPFIAPFLKNCGLVEEGELTDPDKAIHLLEFLVRGDVEQMEYQLPLNKILCGIPLEDPLEESSDELLEELPKIKIDLRPEEKQEAEDVLSSVVKHWSILDGTSNDGLRGTFLLREGKLIQEGDQWRLIVESGTFDMLLEHLPWTLSIIQTPWMENPIWVEWN